MILFNILSCTLNADTSRLIKREESLPSEATLFDYANNGYVEAIREYLLEKDFTDRDENGNTIWNILIENFGSLESVKSLIIEFQHYDSLVLGDEFSILDSAIYVDDPSIVKLIFDSSLRHVGSRVADDLRRVAIAFNSIKVLSYLINRDILDRQLQLSHNDARRGIIRLNGDLEMRNSLAKQLDLEGPLETAIKNGNISAFNLISRYDSQGYHFSYDTLSDPDPDIFNLTLAKKGINLIFENLGNLQNSVLIHMLSTLINNFKDQFKSGTVRVPISSAITINGEPMIYSSFDNINIFRLLLKDYEPDYKYGDKTILMRIAIEGRAELVATYAEIHGLDYVNARDERGKTALTLASNIETREAIRSIGGTK